MKKVALLLADEENAYQQFLVKQAQEISGTYGIDVLPPLFAGNREVKQISQFYDCIASSTPPDGIVSMLVSAESMKGSIEEVVKAGVACVLVNRIPTFLAARATASSKRYTSPRSPRTRSRSGGFRDVSASGSYRTGAMSSSCSVSMEHPPPSSGEEVFWRWLETTSPCKSFQAAG